MQNHEFHFVVLYNEMKFVIIMMAVLLMGSLIDLRSLEK